MHFEKQIDALYHIPFFPLFFYKGLNAEHVKKTKKKNKKQKQKQKILMSMQVLYIQRSQSR